MGARKQRVAVLPLLLLLGLVGWLLPTASSAMALDAPTISAIAGGPAPDAMTITWTTVTGATSYSYTYSTNGGSTYSGKISLGATSPKTVAVRTGCRYEDTAHGSACLFRLYAKSGATYSAPSTAAGPITWGTDVPSAPLSLKVKATSTADTTVTASWKAPTDTGGLPVTSYTVEVSNDSGAYSEVPWSPLSARTFTETTGTCEGNASCQYRAFATTDNGESAASNVATITIKPPGKVTALTFADAGTLDPDPSDGAAGVAPIGLSWTAPAKGIVTGYEWQIAQLTSSATGVRTLSDWGDSTDIGTATSLDTTCAAGSTTCYLRVRAYTHRDTDTDAVFGPWVTVDDEPWAPYSLGGGADRDLTPGRTYGGTQTIGLAVYGPVESGPGPKTSDVKSYEVQACDAVTTDCSVNSDWTTVDTDLAYPDTRTAAIDVSGPCPVDADACSVRVRLVDSVSAASGAFDVGTYDGPWSTVETASGE